VIFTRRNLSSTKGKASLKAHARGTISGDDTEVVVFKRGSEENEMGGLRSGSQNSGRMLYSGQRENGALSLTKTQGGVPTGGTREGGNWLEKRGTDKRAPRGKV